MYELSERYLPFYGFEILLRDRNGLISLFVSLKHILFIAYKRLLRTSGVL